MSCDVGRRHCWDLAWLWLWLWRVATAPIQPLAWEPPYAAGAAQEIATTTTTTTKTKDKKKKIIISFRGTDYFVENLCLLPKKSLLIQEHGVHLDLIKCYVNLSNKSHIFSFHYSFFCCSVFLHSHIICFSVECWGQVISLFFS